MLLQVYAKPCGSELARDGLKGDSFTQKERVIVNDHRRNAARSKLAPTRVMGGYGNSRQA